METIESAASWSDDAAAQWKTATQHAPARALGAPLALTRMTGGGLAFVATEGLVFPEDGLVRLVRELTTTGQDGQPSVAHEVTTFRGGEQLGEPEVGQAPRWEP